MTGRAGNCNGELLQKRHKHRTAVRSPPKNCLQKRKKLWGTNRADRRFSISKNALKQAAGALFREPVIVVEATGLRLAQAARAI